MMTSRISKTTKFVLASAACVLFCTATASAEIVTFWKTNECPNFGGAKIAKASEVGKMEVPIRTFLDFTNFAGIGIGGIGFSCFPLFAIHPSRPRAPPSRYNI